MEAALHSFYWNRKTLKDKDVDEDVMKEFNDTVDAILKKRKQLSLDDKVKETMRNMQYDMQNILKVKSNQDSEDMEVALHSFYANRKTLKEKGVDEDAMKEFSDTVGAILKKPDVRLGKSKEGVKKTLEFINQDLKNMMEAKSDQDSEDMEAALVSFYGNRQSLK